MVDGEERGSLALCMQVLAVQKTIPISLATLDFIPPVLSV